MKIDPPPRSSSAPPRRSPGTGAPPARAFAAATQPGPASAQGPTPPTAVEGEGDAPGEPLDADAAAPVAREGPTESLVPEADAPRALRAEGRLDARRRGHDEVTDALDPETRRSAQLAPPPWVTCPVAAAGAPEPPGEARALATLEHAIPALVRRIAWAGDGRKGSLRLEFAQGPLTGGTLVVHADGGRVKVVLTTPEEVDVAAWRERIASRLAAKGILLDEIVVQ